MDRFDKDKDGRVTLEEFKAEMEPRSSLPIY